MGEPVLHVTVLRPFWDLKLFVGPTRDLDCSLGTIGLQDYLGFDNSTRVVYYQLGLGSLHLRGFSSLVLGLFRRGTCCGGSGFSGRRFGSGLRCRDLLPNFTVFSTGRFVIVVIIIVLVVIVGVIAIGITVVVVIVIVITVVIVIVAVIITILVITIVGHNQHR